MYRQLDLGGDLLERTALIVVCCNWALYVGTKWNLRGGWKESYCAFLFYQGCGFFTHSLQIISELIIHHLVDLMNVSCLFADGISVVRHAVLCSDLYFLTSIITSRTLNLITCEGHVRNCVVVKKSFLVGYFVPWLWVIGGDERRYIARRMYLLHKGNKTQQWMKLVGNGRNSEELNTERILRD